MNAQSEICLDINKTNLLKALQHSFSNCTTVLGELMQNARRAGASKVNFTFDSEQATLSVIDDGCGITDYKTLLTVAESGWDDSVQVTESPFGIGFLSALYACQKFTVVSRCGQLSGTAEHALALQALSIDQSIEWNGLTQVTLTGFSIENESLEKTLLKLAEGFPIPVYYNGVELPRPASLGVMSGLGLDFEVSEIGFVHLRSTTDNPGVPQARDFVKVFLQGLPIYHSGVYEPKYDCCHIVHLDSSKFVARVPDRDKLVDETEMVKTLRQVLDRIARKRFLELKGKWLAIDFVDCFEQLKFWGCVDLLNDIDRVPKQALKMMTGYPVCDTHMFEDFMKTLPHTLTRSEIENGGINIAQIDDYMPSEGAARYLFAWKKDFLLYQGNLDPGHWLHSYIRPLSEEALSLEYIGEELRVYFEGVWVTVAVSFYDRFRIVLGDDSVLIDDDACYLGEQDSHCPGSYLENTVIVPRSVRTADVLMQISNYYDEFDSFQQSAFDEDCEAFAAFLAANTTSDPAEALGRLLPSFIGCPRVFGKSFIVKLDENGLVESVEAA